MTRLTDRLQVGGFKRNSVVGEAINIILLSNMHKVLLTFARVGDYKRMLERFVASAINTREGNWSGTTTVAKSKLGSSAWEKLGSFISNYSRTTTAAKSKLGSSTWEKQGTSISNYSRFHTPMWETFYLKINLLRFLTSLKKNHTKQN
jgi:hypothetical protein